MKYRKIFLLAVILLFSASQAALAAPQAPGQPRRRPPVKASVLVGRISLIEGEILRYVPETKDWVVTVKDTPFGREDAIYSGESGKAEFLMPNNTWIRIGANTQIQLIALKSDTTEVDVPAGIARFINRSSKALIKATTPFGYVVGAPGSIFDLCVGDESVEAIGIKGKIEFIHDVDGARYYVIPGSVSILADNRQACAGDGKVDAEWDDWNISRDSALVHGIETRGESVNHLPDGIREDSGVLDANGRWENVYFEGEYRRAWRPTGVEEGWSPYTVGHWTDWYGDYTWVPCEPFGYLTHHYGYWFRANGCWYWAPPQISTGWDFPERGIGFGWYPGRVGWLYSDTAVGWFPLLPWEPFYSFNWWGPWGFTIHDIGLVKTNFGRYRYWDRAVVVGQSDFHNAVGYNRTRLKNIDAGAIASGFKAAPAIGRDYLKNAGAPAQRFNYTNAAPHSKPTEQVTARVARNQVQFRQIASAVSAGAIRNQVLATHPAKPGNGGKKISSPATRSRNTGTGRQQMLNGNKRRVGTSPPHGANLRQSRGPRNSGSAFGGRRRAGWNGGSSDPRHFPAGRQVPGGAGRHSGGAHGGHR